MVTPLQVPMSRPATFISLDPSRSIWAGKRFSTDADVKQAVTYWIQAINTGNFYAGKSRGATVGFTCLRHGAEASLRIQQILS
jgi:hypothetical protein